MTGYSPRVSIWQGYDLELMSKITSEVKIPVIASGGAGNMMICIRQ